MLIPAKKMRLTFRMTCWTTQISLFTDFTRWKTNQILLDTIDFKLLSIASKLLNSQLTNYVIITQFFVIFSLQTNVTKK